MKRRYNLNVSLTCLLLYLIINICPYVLLKYFNLFDLLTGNGTCLEGGVCECNNRNIGEACDVECVNGYSDNSDTCVCNQICITGYTCNAICNNKGVCDGNGSCICDFDAMVTGAQCDQPGCPGEPDCSEHGTCVAATGECVCDKGWKGIGCQIADCACNGIPAECEQREGDNFPRCYNCSSPYIGDKCQKRFVLYTYSHVS